MTSDFAARLRDRQPVIGFWSVLDSPVLLERLAGVGLDYIALDAQHGLHGKAGLATSLLAIDAAASATTPGATPTVGVVRTEGDDPVHLTTAFDSGAAAVIVPMVESAEQAARVVENARYPPAGNRSYGPHRLLLRFGPDPADVNAQTAVIAMIETDRGLAEVDAICAVPGLDGIYVGPSDLSLRLGAPRPGDPSVSEAFETALATIRTAAERHGKAAGIHCPDGATARRRLAEGFTFASISSDLSHLIAEASRQLATATATPPEVSAP